jgi:hypothetical protein
MTCCLLPRLAPLLVCPGLLQLLDCCQQMRSAALLLSAGSAALKVVRLLQLVRVAAGAV